jgi:hypothetical protein
MTTKDRVRQLARDIWASSGRPVGRDMENWLLAEATVARLDGLRMPELADVARRLGWSRYTRRDGRRGVALRKRELVDRVLGSVPHDLLQTLGRAA